MRVVVDAVEVLHPVQVRFDHRIVLRPRRTLIVFAADETEVRVDGRRTASRRLATEFVGERCRAGDVVEERVPAIVSQIEVVLEDGRRRRRGIDCQAEARKQDGEQRKLRNAVHTAELHLLRSYCAADADVDRPTSDGGIRHRRRAIIRRRQERIAVVVQRRHLADR